MDLFDFEELMAEILNVTDLQREDDSFINQKFYDTYGIEFDLGFNLASSLLKHTIPVEAGLSHKKWHAFVSKKQPIMLMKLEAK